MIAMLYIYFYLLHLKVLTIKKIVE